MSFPIIFNPYAQGAKAEAALESIQRLHPKAQLVPTQEAGDASRLAYELAVKGAPCVVAAGGDGTINEVLNGLARHNAQIEDLANHTRLGVLPLGTMNVFAEELGIKSKELAECWNLIHNGTVTSVDLWQANDRYFVQLAGVGLDAEVVENNNWELKKQIGPLSYAVSAAQCLVREAKTLQVYFDGELEPVEASSMIIGNGRFYGGPVPIFRSALMDDGLLDVVLLKGQGLLEALELLRAMTLDGYKHCKNLQYRQVTGFRVESSDGVPYELDGEVVGDVPVTFKHAGFPLMIQGSLLD